MATSPARRRPRLPSPDISAAEILDSLPPAMLDEILSRLPIRDAARTSVLSRSWRRRWESVPYIVLDWPRGTPSAPIETVLARRTCPISEFRHPYIPEPEFRLSNLWLRRLANLGVQSLYLKFNRQYDMLHSRIFSCLELAVLDLEGCNFPGPPPRFTGFPNLTTLSFADVGFPGGLRGLEALISSSSSLQRLRLENLRMLDANEYWVIHAPNLQHLLISPESHGGLQIDDLPSLEVAEIKIVNDEQGIVNIISRLDQARILKLSMPSPMVNLLEGVSRSFVNLKSLSLHILFCSSGGSLSSFLAISYLGRNAPNLEVLNIELDGYYYHKEDGDDDINVINTQQANLFPSLTSVHMKNVIWNSHEKAFIQFVLSEARKLQVFNIHESVEDARAVAEVAHYKRASPTANVIISRMP